MAATWALAALMPATGARASLPAPSPPQTFETSDYSAATGYMAAPHALVSDGGRLFVFNQRGTTGTPSRLALTWTSNPLDASPSWTGGIQMTTMNSAHAAATFSADRSAIYGVFARVSTSTGTGRHLSFRRITDVDTTPAAGAEQVLLRSSSKTSYGFALVATDSSDRLWLSVRFNNGGVLKNQIYTATGGSDAPVWSFVREAGPATTTTKAWPLALRHVTGRTVFVYADTAAPSPGTYAITHLDDDPTTTWSAPRLITTDLPQSPAWDGTSATSGDGAALYVGMDATTATFRVYRYDVGTDSWSVFGSAAGQDAALATSSTRLAMAMRVSGALTLLDAPLGGGAWSAAQPIGDPAVDVSTARLPALASTNSWWIGAVWSLAGPPSVQVRYQAQAITTPPDTTPPEIGALDPPSAITDTGFTLSWTPATDAGGIERYELDVGTDSAFGDYVTGYQATDVGTALTTSVSGLDVGRTYWARIRAVDPSGNVSASSNVVQATTIDETAPTAPLLDPASDVTDKGFRVSWCCATDNGTVAGYRLDVATDATFTAFASGYDDRDVGSVDTITVTDLLPSTEYHARVRAVDTVGNVSDSSAPVAVTTAPDTTPPAIGTLGPATDVTETGFSLSWTAAQDVSGIAGYQLDVASDPEFTAFVPGYQAADQGSALSAVVTGLDAGRAYYARVRASDTLGNVSADSNVVQATTADTSAPQPPTIAPPSDVTDQSFVVSWCCATDNVGVTGYRLDVATDAAFTAFASGYDGFDAGTATTVTVTALAASTTYYARVRAVDGAGNLSANSDQVTAATAVDSTPPVIGTLDPPSNVFGYGFTLTWSPASDLNGLQRYELDVATDAAFTAFVPGYQTRDVGTGTTVSVSDLESGRAYWARIRAVDLVGNVSADSNVVDATTPDVVLPVAPSLSAPANITDTMIDLSWCCASDNVGVTSYRLDIATDAAFTGVLPAWSDRDLGLIVSTTVTDLTPATTYFIRVRAHDAAGNASANSNVVSATTTGTTVVTLTPTADASVREDQPFMNYGTDAALLARYDPAGISYLTFAPGSRAGQSVLSAHLRMTVVEPSIASGGVVSRVSDTTWTESALSWSNRPVVDGGWLDVLGRADAGQVMDFDVTAAFDAGTGAALPSGAFTLAVQSGASDDVSYRSRENASGGPVLVLTLSAQEPVFAPAHVTRGPFVQNVTETSAVIAWSTALPGESTVRFGVSPALDQTATGPGGTLHAVTLGGLTPGTQIDYVIESGGAAVTPTNTFSTAPPSGSTFTLAAFGDSGIGAGNQMAIAARLDALHPDLVLHVGDLVYRNSDRISWDPYFFMPYAATFARAPMFSAFGNHEAYGEGGQPYIDNLYLPTNSTDGSELYYSFDYGDAHFVSVNTEESLEVGTPQYNWIDNDLRATTKTWKIAFMHRPMYSASPWQPSNTTVQQTLGPLFSARGVQLVLAGHAHDYERTFPQGGVTYVVTGGGGGALYPAGVDSWTAFSATAYHLTTVTISPSLLTLRAVLEDGSPLDSWATTPVTDSQPPAPGVMDPPSQVTQTSFLATWGAGTDDYSILGYHLDVASDEAFTSFVPGYQNLDVGNTLSAPVTGLSSGTTYWARHRAVDTVGNVSTDSNVVSTTTLPPPDTDTTAPIIGTLGVPGDVTATSFSLTWSPAIDDTGVASYRLDVATDPALTTPVRGYQDLDVGTGLSATATGLAPGTSYWARIRAVDPAGNVSADSNAVTATTALVFDDFARTLSGGWGPTGAYSWTIDNGKSADFSVDGNVGAVDGSATGSRSARLGVGTRDVSVLMKFRFTALPTASWNGVYALARAGGSNQWYGLRVRSVAGNSDDLEINKDSSAGLFKVGFTSVVPEFTAGTWYWMRFEAIGDGTTTTVRGRIWADGASEPGSWTVSGTDSTTVLQGASGAGVWTYANSASQPAHIEVDTYSVWLR